MSSGSASGSTTTDRDLEVNWLSRPTDVFRPGAILMATFRVFEYLDRATDDVSITITPPAGITGLSVSCTPEGQFRWVDLPYR